MNPEMINKLNVQREAELKDFDFTKSIMESNAYDFTVKARTLEEAVEIAKGNCPVYSDGMYEEYWGVRYAEGEGNELLQWGEGSNEQSLQLEPTDSGHTSQEHASLTKVKDWFQELINTNAICAGDFYSNGGRLNELINNFLKHH